MYKMNNWRGVIFKGPSAAFPNPSGSISVIEFLKDIIKVPSWNVYVN